jgi:hypothetical protein
MSTRPERVPDWKLERLLLGELSSDELRRVQAALAQEPDGQARLEALRQSNRQLLERLPPEQVVGEVQRRLHLEQVTRAVSAPQRRPLARPLWALVPASLALILALTLRTEVQTGSTGDGVAVDGGGAEFLSGAPTEREKGLRPQLRIYRLRNRQVERVKADSEARAGELLQVGYVAASRPYGMVVSLDGSGALTLHYPEEAGGSTALKTAGEVRLPHSFELDDAPEFERFFLVTSSQPFRPELVLEAAKALASRPEAARSGSLALPAELEQTSLTVRKVKP